MDRKLNIIIVEDEGIICEMLRLMLEDLGHNVVGIAHNKMMGLSLIEKRKYDFAILDINLRGGTEGIQLAEEVRLYKKPFMFLTSYSDRLTIDKMKHTQPGAYVLKPFTEEDIYTGIEMALIHADRQDEVRVTVRDGFKSQLIDQDDILYMKADNVYVEIYTKDRKVISRQTLANALEKLPKDQFFRVHRSYIVNKSKIDTVSKSSLKIGDVTIPISRRHKPLVKRQLDLD